MCVQDLPIVACPFFYRTSRRTTAEPGANQSSSVMQASLGKPMACQSREEGVQEMATPGVGLACVLYIFDLNGGHRSQGPQIHRSSVAVTGYKGVRRSVTGKNYLSFFRACGVLVHIYIHFVSIPCIDCWLGPSTSETRRNYYCRALTGVQSAASQGYSKRRRQRWN